MRVKAMPLILATLAATIAFLLTGPPTSAGAADAAPTAVATQSTVTAEDVGTMAVCGYNDNINGYAVYRHCGDFNIVIYVDSHWPFTDFYTCVPPGDWVLGATWLYNFAYYAGGHHCNVGG